MSKLYVLAYNPGAGGDFLCCKLWEQGSHWAKNSIKPFLSHGIKIAHGPTLVNSYGFYNTLKVLKINDKPLKIYPHELQEQVEFIDDSYGYQNNIKLKKLNSDELEIVYQKIKTYTNNQNLLSSSHIDKNQYSWYPNVKHIVLKVGPFSRDIVDAMRVIKSSFGNDMMFVKMPISEELVQNYFKSGKIPLASQEFFKNRGYVTEWELKELPMHKYTFDQIDPLPVPNPDVWFKHKVKLDIHNMLEDTDMNIDLDLLYKQDTTELRKLFDAFDVELKPYMEERIWNYFDKNIKIYNKWNELGAGDWRNYVITYINNQIQ
jgi:hypothetical protein